VNIINVNLFYSTFTNFFILVTFFTFYKFFISYILYYCMWQCQSYRVTHGAYLHCLFVCTVWWKLVRWQREQSSRCNLTKDLLLMMYSILASVPVGTSCYLPTVNSSVIKGQNPWRQFPRSKSTTSPQHKLQVRNKLAAFSSTGKLWGNVCNGFWA